MQNVEEKSNADILASISQSVLPNNVDPTVGASPDLGGTENQTGGTPATGANAADMTTNFGETTTEETTTIGAGRDAIIKLGQSRKDNPLYRFKKEFSSQCRIAGYITGTDSKVDFAMVRHGTDPKEELSTNKDGSSRKKTVYQSHEYELVVKNTPPSGIKGVAVVFPTALYDALTNKDISTDTVEKVLSTVQKADASHTCKVVPFTGLNEFMQRYGASILFESEDIFEKYVRKSGQREPEVYTNYHMTRNIPVANNNGCPALIRTLGFTKDGNTTLTVKHTLRNRWVTPGNYIAIKSYKTVPMKATFTKAEAEDLTTRYFTRFLERTSSKGIPRESRIAHLGPKQISNFILLNVDGIETIKSNGYFTEDQSKCLLPQMTYGDWYDKDDAGAPVQHPVVGAPFVSMKLTSEGKSASAESRELKSDKATDPELYKFDPNCKVAIAGTVNGTPLITFDVLSEFVGALNSFHTTSPKAKGSRLMGAALADLDESQINAILLANNIEKIKEK